MISIENKKNKVVTVRFKRTKEKILGIFINSGDDWILIKHIPVDFQVDGYVIIKKQNIREIIADEKEKFKENVLKANKKLINSNDDFLKKTDLSNDKVFEFFSFKTELVQIENSSNDIAYIGQITENLKNSIVLKTMGTKGIWLEKKKIAKSRVWCIFFKNDYVVSLKNYSSTINHEI
jgi:hypothetical protein